VPEFGTSAVTATLNGYTFWFKSTANRDKFASDPWAYAPAYGGF
jgi:YHS domain-containing protein